jgi:hypothetical protein
MTMFDWADSIEEETQKDLKSGDGSDEEEEKIILDEEEIKEDSESETKDSEEEENDDEDEKENDDEDENDDEEENDETDEEDDEDEDDEDDEDLDDFLEENLNLVDKNVCCKVPEKITDNNSIQLIEMINQFEKNCEVTCLLNALKLCYSMLFNLSCKEVLSSEDLEFISKAMHFRHDVFSYIIFNSAMDLNLGFKTDVVIPFIQTNKTPDYVLVQDKEITVFECTVVNTSLRANFLKGIDIDSSKYSKEIKELESLGYSLKYKPIFLALQESLEQNVTNLKLLGINISPLIESYLELFMNTIDHSTHYLFSYNFQKTRELSPNVLLNNIMKDNDSWSIIIKTGNKRGFHSIMNRLKTFNFVEFDNYYLRKAKGSNDFFVYYSRSEKNSYKGKYLMDISKDEGKVFETFKKQLVGKDKIHLWTKSIEISRIVIPEHGSFVPYTEKNTGTFKNKKYRNMYSMSRGQNIINYLQKKENILEDLNKENSELSIIEALKLNSDKLAYYSNPNYKVVPPLINNPRRSFLALINTKPCYENEDYKPKLITLSIENCKSTVVKSFYSRIDNINYEKSDAKAEKEDEKDVDFKQDYVYALSNLKSFLYEAGRKYKVEGLLMKKHRLVKKILDNEDLEKFEDLKKKLTSVQTNMPVNLNKRGLLKITGDEKRKIKEEMNWKSNRGYNLYMGETQDINTLIEHVKLVTKKIHFNFTLPERTEYLHYFKKLKSLPRKELEDSFAEISLTSLFQNAVFLSRLAYTLSAASNKTFNSNFVLIDSLKLTDVLLFVKGGRKITSTRCTKIFKLIYPGEPLNKIWNVNDTFISNGNVFDETSWMSLSQNTLLDLMSLPYKVLSMYSLFREKYNSETSLDMTVMPTLLAFHNRRKTEIMLHNMRYPLVNSLGVMSQVDKILDVFAVPSYSAFDDSIIKKFQANFLKYYKTINKWQDLASNGSEGFILSPVHHPYLDRNIMNIDDFTITIYSTYMMSKGHFNQSIEQINNLKSIMETHQYYMEQKRTKVEFDQLSTESIKENDFMYCPEVAYMTGKYVASELKNKHAANNLNIKWNQIMDKGIDDFANNRGLRYSGKDYFGHKGYYIVYKHLLKENKITELLDIINDETITEQKAYQKIKDLNETFYKQQESNKLEQVMFHVVDKSQRGGGREIYVMDYVTKLYQNPIEKMFKFICEFLDNEIISVASSKRSSLIHRKCFEYKNEKFDTYYLTLDCRKWAPRSNPEKYLYFTAGMSEILPDDFVDSVFFYFQMHSKKMIKTRRQISEKFFKNPSNHKYKKYFVEDQEEDSSGFVMEYSFVMGIFNMLSSLFHAGVQILASDVIFRQYSKDKKVVLLDMFAHSDDSAGRLTMLKDETFDTKNELKYVIGKYEFIQKTCNHLMSTKKCNISKRYFELLSILYMNDELLPLLSKFNSNTTLVFSGKGMSSDFKQIISKSIELQSNGATACQAYKQQLIMSNMYRNFYRVRMDLLLPALGGFVDTWPTLYLYAGAACDEVIQCNFNYEFYQKLITFAVNKLEYDVNDGCLNLRYKNVIRMPKAYGSFKKSVQLPIFEDSNWFFQQNKTNNTQLNLLWFRAQLDNKDFGISLLNINEIKRFYDSMYMATLPCIEGKYKKYNLSALFNDIVDTIPCEDKLGYEKVLKITNKNLFEFLNWLENMEEPILSKKTEKTAKPTTLHISNFTDSPISDFNSMHLAVELTRPDLKKYLHKNLKYGTELDAMRRYLENLNAPSDLRSIKTILDYIGKHKEKSVYMYSEVPHNKRIYDNENGLLELMSYNYHKNYTLNETSAVYIKGNIKHSNFDKNVVQAVMGFYLYSIYKKTRVDDLASTIVKVGGKNFELRNINNILDGDVVPAEYIPFINFLEHTDSKPINMKNLTNYAYFTDRQGRIGQDWIGEGKLNLKLEDVHIIMKIMNTQVTEIKYDVKENYVFNENTSTFLFRLMKSLNLNYLNIITPEVGKYYFGLDENNLLGIFDSSRISLSISKNVFDYGIRTKFIEDTYHEFYNGKHYVKSKNFNIRLYTLDNIIFEENKYDIVDMINWDECSEGSKKWFFKVLYRGDYGDFEDLEFDKAQLKDNITKTSLYKFYYNKVVKKENKSMKEAFWEDILATLNYSNEIFPTLYESVELSSLESILPKDKIDTINVYNFFSTDNEEILNLRRKLNSIKDENERMAYYSNLLIRLGNKATLTLLPEVGDPEEFKKFDHKKNPDFFWLNFASVLTDALITAYNLFSINHKNSVLRNQKTEVPITEVNIYKILLTPYLNRPAYSISEYQALTQNQILIHHLIEIIFNSNEYLQSFSFIFRKTFFKNLPRHPIYYFDWQKIIAEYFMAANLRFISIENINIRASMVRNYKIAQRKINIGDYEIFKTFEDDEYIHLIKQSLELEAEDLDDFIKEEIGYKRFFPTPIPLIPIMTVISDGELDEMNIVNVERNSLHIMSTAIEDAMERKEFIDDFFDDSGGEYKIIRKQDSRNMKICFSQDLPYFNNYEENLHYTPLTNIFFENKQTYYKVIGGEMFFVNNINPDMVERNGLKLVTEKMASFREKYLVYYKESKPIETFIEKEIKPVDMDKLIDVNIELEKIKKAIDVTSSETYTENFAKELKELFRLNDEDGDLLKSIVNMKISPLGKYQRIRQVVQNSKGDMSSILEKEISRIFKTQMAKITLPSVDSRQVSISNTISKPRKALVSMTSYKEEMQQIEALTKDNFGLIMTGKIVINKIDKRYILQNLKLLQKTLIGTKFKEAKSFIRILDDIVSSADEGSNNHLGNLFLDYCKSELTELSEILVPEMEDEIFEPEYENIEWNVLKRGR